MRRQKKFYAWGYADEDLTPDEIKPWEKAIAERYRLSSFEVTPPPKAEEMYMPETFGRGASDRVVIE